jgi:hypothetical protein
MDPQRIFDEDANHLRAVEASLDEAVLQRLGHVICLHIVRAGEVGDGARHLQNPVVPARAETETVGGAAQ